MNRRIRNLFYSGFFLISAATFILSFYVPVYIDDIMYPMTTSRAGYDNWTIIGVWPLCANNFNSPIPLSLLPGRWIAWILQSLITTPVAIRLYGMGVFASCVYFLIWMSKKCFAKENGGIDILLTVTSLSFIGVVPFMATLTRPETMMSIAIAFFALLPFNIPASRAGDNCRPIALNILCLLVASWFFSAHPKAIFFAPLMGYSIWKIRKPSLCSRLTMGLLMVIIWQACGYWQYRLTCTDDSVRQQFIMQRTLQPGLLLDDPIAFLTKFLQGIGASADYLNDIFFSLRWYNSDWLPPQSPHMVSSIANDAIAVIVACILGFWELGLTYAAISTLKRRAFLDPYFAVPVCLLAGMALTAGFQQDKNFYDILPFWFAGICLTVIFLMHPAKILPEKIRKAAINGFIVVSVSSQCLLLFTFWSLPQVNRSADSNGALNYTKKSASILHYDDRRQNIMQFALECGISPESANTNLIIDMFTYLPFKQSYKPVFVEHLDDQVLSFAQAHHSSGVITLCSSLPENAKKISMQDKGLCCISKKGLEEFK